MKWAPKSNDFCKAFVPIFDKAAELVQSEFGDSREILLARINCREERGVCYRFEINVFPSFFLVRYSEKKFERVSVPETPEKILQFIKEKQNNF